MPKKQDTPAEAAIKTALAKYIGMKVPGERGHRSFAVPAQAIYQEHYYTEQGARHVHFIFVKDFVNLFGAALPGGEKAPTKPRNAHGVDHEALIAVDPEDDHGHHKYLDKWHDEGLI